MHGARHRVSHAEAARVDALQERVQRRERPRLRDGVAEGGGGVQRGGDGETLAIGKQRTLLVTAEGARERVQLECGGVAVARLGRQHPGDREVAGEPGAHQCRRHVGGRRRGGAGRVEQRVERRSGRGERGRVRFQRVVGEQQGDGLRGHKPDQGPGAPRQLLDGETHAVDRAPDCVPAEHAVRGAGLGDGQLAHHRRMLEDELALLAEALGDVRQDLLQPPAGDRVVGGKVGAPEERRAVGREEHGERVAAQSRERLHGRLVALRDIGSLIAVQPHRHEQRIDQRAQRRVGIRLAVHQRAPAAVFRPHVQQHRPVESGCERERLPTPRLPAHGLAGRAGQVGGAHLRHPVGQGPALGDAGGQQEQRQQAVASHGERGTEYPARQASVPLPPLPPCNQA